MRYKAVLFDMDGVLIDSEHVVRSSAIDALASYGIHAVHEDFIPFTGMDESHFLVVWRGSTVMNMWMPWQTLLMTTMGSG